MKKLARCSSLALLVACAPVHTEARAGSVPTQAAPPLAAPPSPPPSPVVPVAQLPAESPEPLLPWGSHPSRSGPLYVALDGECKHVELWPIEGATLVTYSGEYHTDTSYIAITTWTSGIARLTDRGLEDSPAFRNGYPNGNGEPVTIAGRWPDAVALVTLTGERGHTSDALLTHGDKGWRDGPQTIWNNDYSHDARMPIARGDDLMFVDGHELRAVHLSTTGVARKLPPLMRPAFDAYAMFEHAGELFAVGNDRTGRECVIRRSSAGAVREDAIDELVQYDRHVSTKGALLLYGRARDTFGGWNVQRFDGSRWSPDPINARLASRQMPLVEAHGNDHGEVWFVLANGSLVVEGADGSLRDVSLPEPIATPEADGRRQRAHAYGDVLAGVETDDVWAVGRSGKLFHRIDEAWSKVELPKPPFATHATYAAERVIVTKDEVFLNATYGVEEPGWRTPRAHHAILRSHRPEETVRCDLSGVDKQRGFVSWPTMADDTCRSPFLFLGRLRAKAGDYGPTLDVLRGRSDLGDKVSLVEFSSGGVGYVGLHVPSVAVGRALAIMMGKKAYTFPEVVCADPAASRTWVVNVASGEIVP